MMIFKNIAEYEDKDSELAKFTISQLHSKIDYLQDKISKAIEYIDTWGYDEYDLFRIDENNPNFTTGEDVFTIVETLKSILKGVDKNA